MCGIHLTLSTEQHILPNARTQELLRRRGPDSVRHLNLTTVVHHDGNSHKVYITCYSTVLALRGDATVVQPVTASASANPSANVCRDLLCWNGEAWKLFDASVQANDSEAVFALLSASLSDKSGTAFDLALATSLAAIEGPYAFAHYHDTNQRLSFARDPLGRRSLLSRFDHNGNFFLSSIVDADETGWQEVDADGIYSLDMSSYLQSTLTASRSFPNRIPYSARTSPEIFHKLCISSQQSGAGAYPSLNTASPSVGRLQSLLRQSLHDRISTIPKRFQSRQAGASLRPAALAVLFSGGLDCTVLARMSHDILHPEEPIDLLNVAFENPRVHKRPLGASASVHYSPYELCPDRITGRASFAELQRVCPHRQWRFVAINIPYDETLAHRAEVTSLIHPHNTEMDLSIASALYFAARGTGEVLCPGNLQSQAAYKSEARVLLSGLGADELFGGYQRHATAFSRHGSAGLLEELNLDVGRLGKRNLGRDDRVLSNWARETRFPFLEENLVDWAVSLPVHERCDFGAETGSGPDSTSHSTAHLEPGKKILRCLAWKLDMTGVASEKKRAVSVRLLFTNSWLTLVMQIQFGARTAKMEVGRTKGTHVLTL